MLELSIIQSTTKADSSPSKKGFEQTGKADKDTTRDRSFEAEYETEAEAGKASENTPEDSAERIQDEPKTEKDVVNAESSDDKSTETFQADDLDIVDEEIVQPDFPAFSTGDAKNVENTSVQPREATLKKDVLAGAQTREASDQRPIEKPQNPAKIEVAQTEMAPKAVSTMSKSVVETALSTGPLAKETNIELASVEQRKTLYPTANEEGLPTANKAGTLTGSTNAAVPFSSSIDVQDRLAKQLEVGKEIRSERVQDAEVLRTAGPTQAAVAQTPTPQIAAVMGNVKQTAQLVAKEKSEVSIVSFSDAEVAPLWETRTGSATSTSSLNQVLSRADTPAMVGRQLAEALQKSPDRPVEVSLNPKELGRVRMNISASEAGIVVNVLAERPETLDLMRRNIDQLAREFQAIGYESISFSFSEGQSGQTPDDQASAGQRSNNANEQNIALQVEEPQQQPMKSATTGIDLRM